jgi:hypothetical protein
MQSGKDTTVASESGNEDIANSNFYRIMTTD